MLGEFWGRRIVVGVVGVGLGFLCCGVDVDWRIELISWAGTE